MRKYITLFFLVSLFLLSCNGGKRDPGILDTDQMVGLLTDVHIADGRMYVLVQNPDSLYLHGLGRFMLIFKQHHIDSAGFKKSLKYYSDNPKDLSAIYDHVLANLKKKSDSLNKLQYNNHALPNK